MKQKQLVIKIENAVGRLYEVAKALGEGGINIRALSVVDNGDGFGQLRVVVSDAKKARQILMSGFVPAEVNEVVVVQIEDTPGSLAAMLKPIKDANINVVMAYAFGGTNCGDAVMIFRFNDNDKAVEILQANGYAILDAKDFGILEANGADYLKAVNQ